MSCNVCTGMLIMETLATGLSVFSLNSSRESMSEGTCSLALTASPLAVLDCINLQHCTSLEESIYTALYIMNTLTKGLSRSLLNNFYTEKEPEASEALGTAMARSWDWPWKNSADQPLVLLDPGPAALAPTLTMLFYIFSSDLSIF